MTDRRTAGARSVEDVVRAAVRGGVTLVQLREKEFGTRELVALARCLREILAPAGVPLIINDRVDVALASHAGGVHLGQSDMDPRDARRLLGRGAIIGLTVKASEQAQRTESLDVDYLGVGPIFHPRTKPDAGSLWGVEKLAALRGATDLPLLAIGGIDFTNAASVIEAGADGIAVISAICGAHDPEQAAWELRSVVEQARVKR